MVEFLQQVVNGLLMGGVYALVAVGFSLIFGVLRVLYMTHGEVLMLAAYIGLGAVSLTNSLAVALAYGSITMHSRLPALAAASMASGKASSGYTRGRIGLMSSNPLRSKSSSRR